MVVILEISSWRGISIGAIHWYAELKFDDPAKVVKNTEGYMTCSGLTNVKLERTLLANEAYQNPYLQEQIAMKKAMEFSKQAHVTAMQKSKVSAYYNDPPYPNPYQMPPEKLSKVESMIHELMKKKLTELVMVKSNTSSYQDWLDSAGKPGIPTELMYSEYKYTPKV